MSDRSGLSRGDRNRNARLARLRQLLPLSNAIVGIDLADDKQAAVVTDHDSRVIARRRVSARAWELGDLLDWALGKAAAAGFASVTVACEPTGHRWRVLDQLAAGRGLALVCVQPLLVYRAREGEGLTRDKSGPKDAVIIARLASGLHCYEPERADAVWARLRHLGARRNQLTTDATAQVNQIRDLLECAWPAVLSASGSPFRSCSWRAAVAVVLDRCAGDLARVRRLGPDRFTAAVRRELPSWGAMRPCLRIVRAVFEALADGAGVTAHRPGALERVHLAMGDWRHPGPAGRCRDPDGGRPGRPGADNIARSGEPRPAHPAAAAKAAFSCPRSSELRLTAEDHDELLATADESLDVLAHLAASLLDMSRLEAGVVPVFPRPADLGEIITCSLESLGPPARAVTVGIPAGLPQVTADPAIMERVIANVTANALRYSPAGSPPLLTASACGDRVEVRVTDHGPGVPEADRDQMFAPFRGLADTRTTTAVGLGLTVSRSLTEAMRGTLEAEETPGGGLTMTISVPAASRAAQAHCLSRPTGARGDRISPAPSPRLRP